MNSTKFSLPLLFLFLFLFTAMQAQVDIQADSSNFQSKVTIDNTLENNGMKYPTVDGVNGQVLGTDGDGNLQWVTQDEVTGYDYYSCSVVNNYTLSTYSTSSDSCGNLFDSGGPGSAYGNNEEFRFDLDPMGSFVTRVILHSLDIEEFQDTLWIQGQSYTENISQADTLIFDGSEAIVIEFSSDNVVVADGFHISWDGLYYLGGPIPSPFAGFYFNPIKSSVGGGIEKDSSWTTSGNKSVFFGYKSRSLGERSASLGYENSALGNRSSAFGYQNEATGNNSSAVGRSNIATGDFSSTVGAFNNAIGNGSSALGSQNLASGLYSLAVGRLDSAIGAYSSAIGYNNKVTAENSTAVGMGNSVTESASSAVGYENEATEERSSAFGYANSATGLNSTAFGYQNSATAINSSAFGYANDATGPESMVFGRFSVAAGERSLASGYSSYATGDRSTALGYANFATEFISSAVGYDNEATGERSTAFGYINKATVSNSTAMGHFTTSDVYGMTVIGRYNQLISGSDSFWVSTDPAFVIGIGKNVTDYTNGIVIRKDGNMGIGVNSPAHMLHVATDDAAKPSTNTWTVASDGRLKTNVIPYKEGLELIKSINPVWFSYTGEAEMPRDRAVGVIAQDLQKVAPHMIRNWTYINSKDGSSEDYLGVNNGAMTYMLINAVKEQQASIEAQQLSMEAQKEIIAQQSVEIESLKSLNEKYEALLKRVEALE